MGGVISKEFFDDLDHGVLRSLTTRVRSDDTLMLALRGSYVNVYYRGGSILRLSRMDRSGQYVAEFDHNYARDSGYGVPFLPTQIIAEADCDAWIAALPQLKQIMDLFFARTRKSEREFQQLVAWENNRSGIANSTEYFITDIEYADSAVGARLDMVGLRWLSSERKSGSRCVPVFIEMKYGIDAYEGTASIAKHIADLKTMLGRTETRSQLNETIAGQFEQLDRLGLVKFNRSKAVTSVEVSGVPEVVFLLANHNPRSSKLLNALEKIEETPDFNLRFFAASFAGYGMHDACMMSLADFRERVAAYIA
ncbi:hypothetical protein [Devosia sp. RR2S18]|uniref:hypothetical protein n=1 Tax=Devosia rhizosphaerae TaxID=3049774 RepID=UPI002540E168|nr:hypothetical protein [Devosia sp. RR2S18]WIJ25781.1 hypothetical protein QOV41_03190 [Devosia sp. RR2S18]